MPAPDPALREPLFAETRRRHPEVTLVLLPPVGVPDAAEVSAAATTLVQARELELRTRGVLEELLDVTGREPTSSVTLWWGLGAGGHHRFLARATYVGLAAGAPLDVLRDLHAHLVDSGWPARAEDEPRPRLSGTHGPVSVRAQAYPSAVEIEVVSEVVVLDPTTLATLEGRS